MMSLHFALSSEHSGAIAKRLPHAKNQPSTPGSFFNQFVREIYIYTYIYIHSNLSYPDLRYPGTSLNWAALSTFSQYALSYFQVNY